MRRITLRIVQVIFAMSLLCSMFLADLIILPQAKQNDWFDCVLGMHWGHFSAGLANICVLNAFSDMARSKSVPRNTSIHPPSR